MNQRTERDRITITLRPDVLRRIDAFIDGFQIRNRSHAIEYLLTNSLSAKVRKVFILAGGSGVKMRPLTYELPKTMIPVSGRPILEHLIELLREHDLRDILVLTGPLGDKIRSYFGDGSKFGVKINYLEEDKPSGTARPILKARAWLEPGPFLVMYGDVLAEINLKDMITFHEQCGGVTTIAVTSVDRSGDWGVVNLQGQRVISFTEKPHRPDVSHNINAGIFIMETNIFDYIPDRPFVMLEKDIFPKMAKDSVLCGYSFSGQWFDVSTPETYEHVLKTWQK